MPHFFTITSFLFLSVKLYCQSATAPVGYQKNAITVEALGHSRGLVSINYERLFKPQGDNILFSIRTGVGYTPGINIGSKRLKGSAYVPLVLSLLAGKKSHFAQFGLGYTAAFGHDFVDSTTSPPTIYQKFESAYIVSLGYRYMNNHGMVAQIYPLLQWTNNPTSKFAVGFGLSIGETF
jgi:hypothetical protein